MSRTRKASGFGLRASGFGLVLAMMLATIGCKHDAPPPTTPVGGSDDVAAKPAPKPKTPYESRRAATCTRVAKTMVGCAVDEAKADLAAGKTTKSAFDQDTKPEVLAKYQDEMFKQCAQITTTYQLRVFEVCQDKESACDPLRDCLQHVNDPQPASKP